MTLPLSPVSITLPVAWGEMDALGHVNNVAYFRYLESARVEFMRRVGFNELRMAHGVGVILQHVQCRFRRPLFFPDTLTVTAKPATVESDRFTLEHEVVSAAQGVVAAVGTSTIVTYDYERATKVSIPDPLRKAIESLRTG